MGTLGGHLLPGTFFILFALWWSFVTALRYIQSKKRSSSLRRRGQLVGYKSTVTMPCICMPCDSFKRAPLESWIKLIFALIGLLGEIITGIKHDEKIVPDWPPKVDATTTTTTTVPTGQATVHVHNHGDHASQPLNASGIPPGMHLEKFTYLIETNTQHSTMYSAFIFGAVVELLVHYRVDLPKYFEYVAFLLGFSIEAFLFANHLHARDELDIHVHKLLVYAVYGSIVCILLEMYDRSQVLYTYGRILFTLLQGTWFWQVGFVLYPPTDNPKYKWDLNDHAQIMTITMAYCWHVILIIVGLMVELFVIKRIYVRSKFMALGWDVLMVIDEEERTSEHFGYKNLNETRFGGTSPTGDIESSSECLSNEIVRLENRRASSLKDASLTKMAADSRSPIDSSAEFIHKGIIQIMNSANSHSSGKGSPKQNLA